MSLRRVPSQPLLDNISHLTSGDVRDAFQVTHVSHPVNYSEHIAGAPIVVRRTLGAIVKKFVSIPSMGGRGECRGSQERECGLRISAATPLTVLQYVCHRGHELRSCCGAGSAGLGLLSFRLCAGFNVGHAPGRHE
jgi:hypothetical protein